MRDGINEAITAGAHDMHEAANWVRVKDQILKECQGLQDHTPIIIRIGSEEIEAGPTFKKQMQFSLGWLRKQGN